MMVPLKTTSSSKRKVTQTQPESYDCSNSSSSSSPYSVGPPSALKFAFPTKLYAMLELADSIPYFSKAITWLPHGRAFLIIDEVTFMQQIVPYFFNQTRLHSFNRQLHLWGFKRSVKKKYKYQTIWYHDNFLRGVPQAIYQMVRVKIKGQAAASKKNRGDDEPDFDGMPPLPSNTTLPSDVLSIMEEVRLHFDPMSGSSSLNRCIQASLPPATTTSINSYGFLPFCPLTRAVSNENAQANNRSTETIVNLVWSGQLNSLPISSPFNPPLGPNKHNNNEDWEPLPIIRDDFAKFIEDTIQMV